MMRRWFILLIIGGCVVKAAAQALPELDEYGVLAQQALGYVQTSDHGAASGIRGTLKESAEEALVAAELRRDQLEAAAYADLVGFPDEDDILFLEAMLELSDFGLHTALVDWMMTRYAESDTATNRAAAEIALTNVIGSIESIQTQLASIQPTFEQIALPPHPVERIVAPVWAAPGEIVPIEVTVVNVGGQTAQNIRLRLWAAPFTAKEVQDVNIGELAPGDVSVHYFVVKIPPGAGTATYTVHVDSDNGAWSRSRMVAIGVGAFQ